LEDGVFNWYEGTIHNLLPTWTLLSPLNPQPGSVEGKPKKRKKPRQTARAKAVWSSRVPKDMAEDGYEVLETLVDSVRDKLAPEMGWSSTVPSYYVLCASLANTLQNA